MNICFPVLADQGLNSEIYGHFPSAPLFLIIDTATGTTRTVANCDPVDPYAGCNPFSALRQEKLVAVVVDAIGDDAVRTMNLCGFKVYRALSRAVSDNVAFLANGALAEVPVMESHLEGRCSIGESVCNCSHHHHSTSGETMQ